MYKEVVILGTLMMDPTDRQLIIKTSWDLHNQIENAYLNHTAAQGDTEWLEKQRLLLADMAIHLLQTAMNPNTIQLDKLKNNLHAILTITDQFLPTAELKSATDKLYD